MKRKAIVESRLLNLAQWHASEKPNQWVIQFELILLVVDVLNENKIYEIALPIDATKIKKWNFHQ